MRILFVQDLLRIPIRGYENKSAVVNFHDLRLRIPIRGYEIQKLRKSPELVFVTNPYKGL